MSQRPRERGLGRSSSSQHEAVNATGGLSSAAATAASSLSSTSGGRPSRPRPSLPSSRPEGSPLTLPDASTTSVGPRQLFDPYADGSAPTRGGPSVGERERRGGAMAHRGGAEEGTAPPTTATTAKRRARRGGANKANKQQQQQQEAVQQLGGEDGLWSALRFALRNVVKASTGPQLAAALTQATEAIHSRQQQQQHQRQAEEGACALLRACVSVLERGSKADLLAAVVEALKRMGPAPPFRAGLLSCFPDLVDLLLGYTLDPNLPDEVRACLEELLESWGGEEASLWWEHASLGQDFLSLFLEDMQELLRDPQQSPRSAACHEPRFRGLAGLFVILLSCLPPPSPKGWEVLRSFLTLVCLDLCPSNNDELQGEDEGLLDVFLCRCLLKVFEALQHCPCEAPSPPLPLTAYCLAAHFCLLGGLAPPAIDWPLSRVELGLSTHLALLHSLPPPALLSLEPSLVLGRLLAPRVDQALHDGDSPALPQSWLWDWCVLSCWPPALRELLALTLAQLITRLPTPQDRQDGATHLMQHLSLEPGGQEVMLQALSSLVPMLREDGRLCVLSPALTALAQGPQEGRGNGAGLQLAKDVLQGQGLGHEGRQAALAVVSRALGQGEGEGEGLQHLLDTLDQHSHDHSLVQGLATHLAHAAPSLLPRLLAPLQHHEEGGEGEGSVRLSALTRLVKLAPLLPCSTLLHYGLPSLALQALAQRRCPPSLRPLYLHLLCVCWLKGGGWEGERELDEQAVEVVRCTLLLPLSPDAVLASPLQRPDNARRFLEYLTTTGGQVDECLQWLQDGALAGAQGAAQALTEVLQGQEDVRVMDGPHSLATTSTQPQGQLEGGLLGAAKRLEQVLKRGEREGQVWGVWEAARGLTWGRLRSHVGGASQTFAALEKALVKAKLELTSQGGAGQGAKRAGLLLGLFEALERHVDNAGEGSMATDTGRHAVKKLRHALDKQHEAQAPEEEEGEGEGVWLSLVLCGVSKNTEVFFRSNRRVCKDWFARVRPLLLQLAWLLRVPYDVMRLGMARLQEIGAGRRKGQGGELEELAVTLAGAMAELQDVAALQGLKSFLLHTLAHDKDGLPSPVAWLDALMCQAQGRVEEAAKKWTDLLPPPPQPASHDRQALLSQVTSKTGTVAVLRLAVEQGLDCHVALGDWPALAAFLRTLQALRTALEAPTGEGEGEGEEEKEGAWVRGCLVARGDASLVQCLIRLDSLSMRAALKHHPSMSSKDLASALATLAPASDTDGAQAVERCLCRVLDESMATLLDRSHASHSVRVAALEHHSKALLTDVLPRALSATSDSLLSRPPPLPSCPLLLDLSCLCSVALDLPCASSSAAAPSLSSLPQVMGLRGFTGPPPSSSCAGVLDTVGWRHLLRTCVVKASIAKALASNQGAEAGMGREAMEGRERDVRLVQLGALRHARKHAHSRHYAVDLLHAARGGWGSAGPMEEAGREVVLGYEAAQVEALKGTGHGLANALRTLLALALRLTPAGVVGEHWGGHWGELVQGGGPPLLPLLAPDMAGHWLYRCLARCARWLCGAPLPQSCLAALDPDEPLAQELLPPGQHRQEGLVFKCLTLAASHGCPTAPKPWRLLADLSYRRAKALSASCPVLCPQEDVALDSMAQALGGLHASADPSRAGRERIKGLLLQAVALPNAASAEEEVDEEASVSQELHHGLGLSSTREEEEEEGGGGSLVKEAVALVLRLRKEKRQALTHHAVTALKSYSRQLSLLRGEDDKEASLASLSCLRCLKLLPHLPEAQDLQALKDTGVEHWRRVGPQLLARLCSPSAVLSSGAGAGAGADVVEALCQGVVLAYPQDALAWAVLVRRREAGAALDEQGQRDEEAGPRTRALAQLGQRLGRLEHSMAQQHGTLLQHMAAFLTGCVGLSGLLSERWVHVVCEHWGSLHSRLRALSRDAHRLASAPPSSAEHGPLLTEAEKLRIARERYRAVLLPLSTTLNALYTTTLLPAPATPHDAAFHAAFKGAISEALAMLHTPPDDASALSPLTHAWPRLQALKASLVEHSKASPSLPLAHVAPPLWQLCFSSSSLLVPCLGHDTFWAPQASEGGVRIVGALSKVWVLRTKTRPKRLGLLGSDGRLYRYLLKGREDVHVDATVMQLLAHTNSMLRRSQRKPHSSLGPGASVDVLGLRHYAVLPLCGSAGLIQWVEGLVPLFQLYTKHNQRTARGQLLVQQALPPPPPPDPKASAPPAPTPPPAQEAQQQAQAEAGGDKGRRRRRRRGKQQREDDKDKDKDKTPTAAQPALAPVPPRAPATAPATALGVEGEEEKSPAALFYAHLVPALAKRGLDASVSREQWPLEVLREVWGALKHKAPIHVIQQEMGAGAANSKHWYQRCRALAVSVGVSSMVGHVLGLGDRHLANVLLDEVRAQVVHIDYNVCFDRGSRLRVPEVVPFRLTPALATALGPLGHRQGHFRHACEATLRVLRQQREASVALLQALVLDPLVHWTSIMAMQTHTQHGGGGAHGGSVEARVTLSLFALRVKELRGALGQHVGALEEGALAMARVYEALASLRAQWSGPRVEEEVRRMDEREKQLRRQEEEEEAQAGALGLERHQLWGALTHAHQQRAALDQALQQAATDVQGQWQLEHEALELVLGGEDTGPLPDAALTLLRQKLRKALTSPQASVVTLAPSLCVLSEGGSRWTVAATPQGRVHLIKR